VLTHNHETDQDEQGHPLNPFAEILCVMDTEHLIRLRRRLEEVGKKRMVEILTDEIEEREAIELSVWRAKHTPSSNHKLGGG
jgi:hypothetical protein